MKPIEMPAATVSVKVEDASYRVPGRAMQMTLTITLVASHSGLT
jgi:methane/ammonia monooxygenase subunit B